MQPLGDAKALAPKEMSVRVSEAREEGGGHVWVCVLL